MNLLGRSPTLPGQGYTHFADETDSMGPGNPYDDPHEFKGEGFNVGTAILLVAGMCICDAVDFCKNGAKKLFGG